MQCEICGLPISSHAKRVVRLPKMFWVDHTWSRELPGGELIKETKTTVIVSATDCELDELLDDAEYWDWNSDTFHSDERALCMSASRTIKALEKQRV